VSDEKEADDGTLRWGLKNLAEKIGEWREPVEDILRMALVTQNIEKHKLLVEWENAGCVVTTLDERIRVRAETLREAVDKAVARLDPAD